MITHIPDFSAARVLIIGDVMLDRYWQGGTSRISPEAPVPVVHIQQQTERPGGAGNVALNIAALQAQATLIGLLGDDEPASSITQQLQQQQVNCQLLRVTNYPTITKLRILSRHQQLIRLDFEQHFAAEQARPLLALAQQHLAQADVVILSDYGKGALCEPQAFIQAARAAGKPVLVDPKGNDFSKYHGATVITPNRTEFEAVVGPCVNEAELVRKGMDLCQQLSLTALLITRSEQGMTLLRPGQAPLHLPAHAREVYDVTGAGDTVIALLATVLALGADLVQATTLANLAAGLVVTKLGAVPVNRDELVYVLDTHHGDRLSRDGLAAAVRSAQAQGEVVVMTNGCFDILHAGHIQYLTQARQLGDRLIVAVNDDASVRRLKGEQRPIHSLEQRLTVLSALACVDWVIPFSEDTPKELICQVLPDILVKGGDYQVADIAGGECVLAAGGRVQVLDFVQGCSTTAIIDAMQRL